MTTTDYLSRELRRARLSLHRAEKKPNTPESEMQGLRDKIACLEEALAAVQGREPALAHLDRDAWEPCARCKACSSCAHFLSKDAYEFCKKCITGQEHMPLTKYCSACGRPLTDAAWAELERRVDSCR